MSTHSTRRRLIFALILLVLPVLALSIRPLWNWSDFNPRPTFILTMIGWGIALACWIALPVWLFALSGISGRTKAILAGLMLLIVGTAVASIDDVQWNGYIQPIPHFRWQGRPQDRLEEYLAEQDDSQGLPPIDLSIDPVADFPRYRGARGDGVVIPTELLQMNWSEKAPELLWEKPCGGGFSGFAIAGNVAITLEQRRDKEVVVCYDRATGKQRWEYPYDAFFRDPLADKGPRATPAIADDDVYSLGATGELVCLVGKTGAHRWSVNILADNAAKPKRWGMAGSPLIVGDLVIVHPGVDPDNNVGRSLAAYDRKTGKRVWGAGTFQSSYSSPHKAKLLQRDQVLIFHAAGLASFDPKTGKELWQYPWKTGMEMNIIQPVVLGEDRVLISSETNNGCATLAISRKGNEFTAAEVWANHNLCAKFSNPVALGGAIYGLSDGTFVCLDQRTGRRYWRGKRYGHGQILAAGGALLVMGERGEMAVVAADTKRFRELGRLEVFKGKTWNTPALAGRQLFLRNDAEMACYELPLLQEEKQAAQP
jgi:outer membrane protein assembly factor BamB